MRLSKAKIILAMIYPLLCSVPAFAGYLDVSGNWSAPSTVPMSKSSALSVAGQCKAVKAYSNMAGTTSGAMIVAGPHPTDTDKKIHLTARLYKNNNHEKSCHIYIGKNNAFTSCNCEYVD